MSDLLLDEPTDLALKRQTRSVIFLILNRMTASVLKQDPNTKRFKRTLFILTVLK